jgi:hypothetical protein
MAGEQNPEPKQKTPKGAEIPIPTRDAVLRDLMKAAPKAPSAPDKSPK